MIIGHRSNNKRSQIMDTCSELYFLSYFPTRTIAQKRNLNQYPSMRFHDDHWSHRSKRLKKYFETRVIKIETGRTGGSSRKQDLPSSSSPFFSHRYRTLNCSLEELLWTVVGYYCAPARRWNARRREHPFHKIRHVPVYYDSISGKWRLCSPRRQKTRLAPSKSAPLFLLRDEIDAARFALIGPTIDRNWKFFPSYARRNFGKDSTFHILITKPSFFPTKITSIIVAFIANSKFLS